MSVMCVICAPPRDESLGGVPCNGHHAMKCCPFRALCALAPLVRTCCSGACVSAGWVRVPGLRGPLSKLAEASGCRARNAFVGRSCGSKCHAVARLSRTLCMCRCGRWCDPGAAICRHGEAWQRSLLQKGF